MLGTDLYLMSGEDLNQAATEQEDMGCIEVLLVEDNPGDVFFVKEAFSELGVPYHLNVAGDGLAAMNSLRVQSGSANTLMPDLIVLDLNLPIMDGKEFFDAYIKDAGLRTIPLVVLTSSTLEREAMIERGLSPDGYFLKPSTLAEFIDVARRIEGFRQAFRG